MPATLTYEEFAKQTLESLRKRMESWARRQGAAVRGASVKKSSRRRRGLALPALDPEELAGRMAKLLPVTSVWDDVLGPFYSGSGIRTALGGISRQAIAARRKQHRLLALRTSDGELVYPVFQVDHRRQDLFAGLAEVIKCFGGGDVSQWTVASWLMTAQPGLDGLSVVNWLKHGRSKEAAIALARDQAGRYRW